MRMTFVAAAAAAVFAATPAVADTITYNSTPTVPFSFGSGNGYAPANTAVLTTGNGTEIDLRAHAYQVQAPASNATGTYSFALGSNVGFDFAYAGLTNATITLTNLLTGQTASFSPSSLPDNTLVNGSTQNSERLNFAFLNGGSIFGNLGYNANVDDTYQINLAGSDSAGAPHSLSIFAQLGTGGAVPEPATWAMMLLGFGAIGASMRRRKPTLAQLA